jgi:hypothetical protein
LAALPAFFAAFFAAFGRLDFARPFFAARAGRAGRAGRRDFAIILLL